MTNFYGTNMNLEQFRHQHEIAGSTLSYLDIGQGPVLLFGHSYLWCAKSWLPQLEQLSKNYRCIVPDLWAHGQSGAIPKDCRNLVDLGQNMLELMDRIDISTFTIIGQSVGGMWGTELALSAPARVNGLVLINTFIAFEPEVTREKYMAMLNQVKNAQAVEATLIEQIAALYFGNHTHEQQPALVEQFKFSLKNMSTALINDVVKMGRMIFGRRDTSEYAEQLTLPCLILSGVEDKVRTVLEGYLMQDVIDASQFEHIQGAGHMATLEQPEVLNLKLASFLSQV